MIQNMIQQFGTIPDMTNPKRMTSMANTYNSSLVGPREKEKAYESKVPLWDLNASIKVV